MKPRSSRTARRRMLGGACIVVVVALTGCRGDDEPTPTTTSPPTTTESSVAAALPVIDAVTLADALAARDAEALAGLDPLVAPSSPAEAYLAHQSAARALLGDGEPATVRTVGAVVEICESPTDCLPVDDLDVDPATGLLRSFTIGGESIDGRVTGAGPAATTDEVTVTVASAARSSSGALTVVLAIDNASTVPVEWFGFASVYVDPVGTAVEATGAWGDPVVAAGASGEILVAFPDQPLGGVVELSGLRDDGIDLSLTVVVPDSD